MEEKVLIARAAGGDRDALGELLMAHRTACYSFALRLSHDPEDAEDICQESFARAVRDPSAYRGGGSFRSWLLGIVLNVHREMRGSELARRRRERNYAMSHPVDPDAGRGVEAESIEKKELREALNASLADIEEDYSLPIVLHYEQGLTHPEIAAMLSMPPGTVKTNIRRGLEKLRAAMARAGYAGISAVAVEEALSMGPHVNVPASLAEYIKELTGGGAGGGGRPGDAREPAGGREGRSGRDGDEADSSRHDAASGASAGNLAGTAAGGIAEAARTGKGVGGLMMKIGIGMVAVGVATGVALWAVSGGRAEDRAGEKTSPAAAKVPGRDYPYGEGVVYRRQIAAIGSLTNGGYQDGPGPQMELTGGVARVMAPNGDWYFLDFEKDIVLVKYDAKKKRAFTIGWAGPYGKRGGPAECARFRGGGYAAGMGLSMDSSGKFLVIHDTNNDGYLWRMDLEKMIVEPAPAADVVKGAAVKGTAPDGSIYFAKDDGKLKKASPDGKVVQDLGVTLEGPLRLPSYSGGFLVNEKLSRLYAGSRDPYSPWGVFWYWDIKTGKAAGLAGPKRIGDGGKIVAQDGGEVDKNFHCASGPADKVSFWCTGGPAFGPDMGDRYLYLPGGDESTCSRLDLEKRYVTKLVRADPKGDRSLWTFGEGRQGRDYRFADPYCWAGAPIWGPDGEFYMTWALCSAIDIYTPVQGSGPTGTGGRK